MSETLGTNITQFLGGQSFNPMTAPPAQDFSAFKPGEYDLLIDNVEIKPTKAGNGAYAEITHSVVDGPCKGRKLWNRINIANPSQKCVEIGFGQLGNLTRAAGFTTELSDLAPLKDKIVKAKVRVVNEQNEIAIYLEPSQQAPAQQYNTAFIGAPSPVFPTPQVTAQQFIPQFQQQPVYAPPQVPQAPQQPVAPQPAAGAVTAVPPWMRK